MPQRPLSVSASSFIETLRTYSSNTTNQLDTQWTSLTLNLGLMDATSAELQSLSRLRELPLHASIVKTGLSTHPVVTFYTWESCPIYEDEREVLHIYPFWISRAKIFRILAREYVTPYDNQRLMSAIEDDVNLHESHLVDLLVSGVFQAHIDRLLKRRPEIAKVYGSPLLNARGSSERRPSRLRSIKSLVLGRLFRERDMPVVGNGIKLLMDAVSLPTLIPTLPPLYCSLAPVGLEIKTAGNALQVSEKDIKLLPLKPQTL